MHTTNRDVDLAVFMLVVSPDSSVSYRYHERHTGAIPRLGFGRLNTDRCYSFELSPSAGVIRLV